MPKARNIDTQPANASLATFTIKIGGTPLPRQYSVSEAGIRREVNKIPRLHLTLLDGNAAQANFELSNTELLIPGNDIEFWGGYNMQETLLFKGIIIRHSIKISNGGNSVLLIEAADAIIKMTTTPKRAIYHDLSHSAMFQQIADGYALATEISATSFVHKQMVQYYASDWDFIQTTAETSGLICICENGKLVIQPPALEANAELDLSFGATILELHAEMDARHQYDSVESASWDSSNQSLLHQQAAPPKMKEAGNLSATDLAQKIQQPPLQLIHGGNVEEALLQDWADIQLLKSRLAKIRGTVSFSGAPHIMPGMMVDLKGLGNRFNGAVFVSGVKHDFFQGAWTSHLQIGLSPQWFAAENNIQSLPAAGRVPGIMGLQIGIVTDLEDPDGAFRIKVKIPTVDNQGDGIWCKMAMPDAGKDRGFYFRPEMDDEVVIGFLEADPNYGVVLGCLHSAAKGAPLKPSNQNDEKGIISRSGMKWIWNDAEKSLKIDTPAGNSVSLSEEAAAIKLEDQHGNKIIMDGDGIRLESIKDIQLKANGNIQGSAVANLEWKGLSAKISGTGSAEFSSTGIAEIKGSIVKIN